MLYWSGLFMPLAMLAAIVMTLLPYKYKPKDKNLKVGLLRIFLSMTLGMLALWLELYRCYVRTTAQDWSGLLDTMSALIVIHGIFMLILMTLNGWRISQLLKFVQYGNR